MIRHIDLLRRADPAKFFLKWNDFESQILAGFSQLYVSKSMADVTLICEGTSIKAHKLVLSMYSPYLRMILTEAPGKHPVVTIDGMKARDLINVLEFLYLGKVCVKHEDIESFVETARFLNIDGIQGDKKSNVEFFRDLDNLSKPEIPKAWTGHHGMSPLVHTAAQPWIKNKRPGLPAPVVPQLPPPPPPPPPPPTGEPRAFQPPQEQQQQRQPPPRSVQQPLYVPALHASSAPPPADDTQMLCPVNNVRPFPNPRIIYPEYYRGPTIQEISPPGSPGRCTDASDNDEPIDMQIKPDSRPQASNPPKPPEAVPSKSPEESPRDIELFTTPSGLIVSTAFGKKQLPRCWSIVPQLTGSGGGGGIAPPARVPSFMPTRRFYPYPALPSRPGPPPTPSPTTNPLCLTNKPTAASAPKDSNSPNNHPSPPQVLKGPSGLHYNKSIKYTPSQVRALVQSVDGLAGPFVPCKICQKVVKRERLRTHIYECHLVNGEKITCQYCGVALKSKGSYRVHVWRHRNGNLKKSKVKEVPRSASQ